MNSPLRYIILPLLLHATVCFSQLDHFVVQSPGEGNIRDQIAGVTFFIEVRGVDSLDNTVTTFEGTADITSNGVLTIGAGTTPAFVGGVLSGYSVQYLTTGTFSITATRTSGSETGTSNAFSVQAGSAAHLFILTQPASTDSAGMAFAPQPVIGIQDAYGNLVSSDNSTLVTASLNSGTGELQGTVTTTAVSGMATFTNLSYQVAETITLAFNAQSLSGVVSNSIVVQPASAAEIRVETDTNSSGTILPSQSVVMGKSITMHAITRDAYHNFISNSAANWSLLGSTGGIISGDLLPSGDTRGAVFTGHLVGTTQVRATSGGLDSISSGTITVTPGPAKHLSFVQQPTNDSAGTIITPPVTVQLKDSLGNDVHLPGISVTIALSSGTGTLSGTTSQSTNSSGVATFNDLSINFIGTKQLTASSAGLTPAVSTSFSITPAAVSQLVFVQQPTNDTAGTIITPPITVQLRDGLGNNVSTSGVSIAMALSSGTGTLGGTTTRTTNGTGLATFNNLSINLVGTKQLTASSAGLTPAVSNSFSITPAAASELVFIQQPANDTAGTIITPAITVQLRDGSGNDVSTSGVSIAIALSSGTGTLGGITTRTTNGSGLVTFNDLSINLIGTKQLTASSAGLTPAVSSSFSITPAAVSQLVFIQQPTNDTAGTNITPAITVQLRDGLGNNVSSSGVSIAMALSSGTGTLSGTISQSTNSSGLATFNDLNINLVGTKRLTASSAGLTPAVSSFFSITPAAADQLVFIQQPTNGTAGTSIAPAITVQLRDGSGNNVSSSGVSIAMSLSSGTGTLGGTTTRTTNAGGLATFNNLSINLIGTKQLTASSAGLTPAVSSSFSINPAAVSQLVFIQQPTNGIAGTIITPAITVQLRDGLGNDVSSSGVSIAIALSSGTGTLSGTTPRTTDASGVATFNDLSVNLVGTKQLTASSAGLTPAVSSSFSIATAAASQLVFIQQPTNDTAGTIITPPITVQLRDGLGNDISTSGVSIAMALSSGTGTLGGTTGQLTNASGVAAFDDLSINLVGTKQLTASSAGLTPAVSGSFSITPAAASQLVFIQQPTNDTAGTTITPAITVQLRDGSGNNVSTSGVPVAVALSGGTGTLGGTTTRTTNASGLATFNDLSINLAGTKQLTASSAGLTPAVSNSFSINPAAATQLVFIQQPTNDTAGTIITPAITVQLRDGLGNDVSTAGVSVAMALSSGTGTLSGTTPRTTDASGVATFNNLSINLVGTKQLTASSAGLSPAVSSSFSIAPAAADQLVFIQQPTNGTAGTSIAPAITVQLRDGLGNNVSSSGVSIAMALSSGTGTLGGTTTRTTNASGLATFNDLSINLVGTKQLTASSAGLTPAVSSSFSINPAAVSQLVFIQQPTNDTAGTIITPAITVQLRDGLGNNVSSSGVSITMALSSGTGALGGTTTRTTNASGLATFNDLSINLAGTKQLTASSAGLTPAVSSSFSIAPAAASQLVFIQQPTNDTAGTIITPAITVQLRDGLGNDVPSAGVSITMGLSSGTGTLTGTTSRSTNSSGVATFDDLSINLVGTKQLTASGAGLTPAVSSSFSINPAAVSQLVFIQQPTNDTAGTIITPAITVQLRDELGNNVSSSGVSITMALSSGTGTLGGTTARTTNASGLATFNDLSINLVGTKQLTASSAGLTPAVSGSFSINPAAVSQLVFIQQPTNDTAGTIITPAITVQLRDGLGNNVSSSGVSITMALSSGTGTLGGTTTRTTNASGLATFNDLSINLVGTKQLTASSAGLTPAVSTSFSINPAAASQLVFIQQPTNDTAGTIVTPAITVQLRDGLGNNVSSSGVSITMALSSGTGTLGGTTSRSTNSSGVATFNDLSINLVGTKQLTASSAGLTPAVSSSFSITPAGAGQLVFIQQPTNDTAGTIITPAITVQLRDSSGNNVSTSGVSITMALSTGTGTLGGTTTRTTNASGLATFNDLSINLVGTKQLTASSAGLTPAVSTSFSITPAAVSQLVFIQQPTNDTAGTTITPAITVQLRDGLGNNVSSAGVSITMALSSGTGTLSGTTPRTTNASGIATFNDLSINLVGTKQLTASSAGLTPAVSSSFSITPAAVSQLVFIQQPTNGTAGTIITPPITVQLRDGLGNDISTSGVSIAMALSSGTGTLGGTTAQLTNASGVATFDDLSINLVGTKQLTASSAGLTPAVSSSFSITPAAASQLVFIQQPTDDTAGTIITPAITVQLRDGLGNNVSTSGVSIAMALSGGTGTLGGTTTRTTNGSGLATFNDLSINLVGTKQLTASSAGLTPAVSSSFSITPAAASQLVFIQQPTDDTAGTIITPPITVQLRDGSGNDVSTSGVSIAMALSGGTGTLGGTTAQLTNASGVATFDDLSINLVGTKQLTASSAGLSPAVSSSFSIAPAAASQLVFIQQPTNDTAGTIITPAIAVQVRDGLGNDISTSGVSIAMALSSGTGTLSGTTSQSTNSSGVATFNDLSINLVGTKQLTASSAGLTPAVSSSFSITSAAASQLVFIQQPTNGTAGTIITPAITVQLRDGLGNDVPSSGVSIAMALSSGTGTLGGTTTRTTNGTGLATFNDLSINLAGSKTLSATSGSFTQATSDSFIVSPAPPRRISVETQADGAGAIVPMQTIGSRNSIVVYAVTRDTFSNYIANASAAWSLDSVQGKVVGSDLVPFNANRAARFTAHLNGSAVIKATLGSLTPITSGALSVVSGSVVRLLFVQEPTNTAAGATINPAISVQLKDSIGNNSPIPGVSIHLTMAGSGSLNGTTTKATDASGLAVFNDINITIAGVKTIFASSGSLIPDSSAAFTITPGAAASLVFVQQPQNDTAGTILEPPPSVQVQDSFANNVGIAGDSITVSLAHGITGTLSGTLTRLTNASGLATFDDLTIDQTGIKALLASHGGYTAAQSNNFTLTGFTISASAGIHGSIAPSGSLSFIHGASQTFTITPDTGYHIDSLIVDDAYAGRDTSYTFASISASHTIRVTFAVNVYTVLVGTIPDSLDVLVDGIAHRSPGRFSWNYRSTHTIAAIDTQSRSPNVRYIYTGWSDGNSDSHSITIRSDSTFVAHFGLQYFVRMTADTGGTVSPASNWFNSGAKVTLQAIPHADYRFSGWQGTGSGSYSDTLNPVDISIGAPISETATFNRLTLLPPLLTGIPDGASSITTSPTLKWYRYPGATSYTVLVSTDSTFADTATNHYWSLTITDTSVQLSDLANNTAFYWRVRARITDKETPYSSTYRFITINATVAVVSSPNTWATTYTYRIQWLTTNLSGGVNVKISLDSGKSFSSIKANITDSGSTMWTVPEFNHPIDSCSYRVESFLNPRIYGQSGVFSIVPGTLPSRVRMSTIIPFPANPTVSTSYQLISFPGIVDSITMSLYSLGTEKVDWRMFRDNGNPQDYLEELSGTTSLRIGEGYWLINKGNFALPAFDLRMPRLDSTASLMIPLHHGWNILGSPFDKAVPWQSVLNANNLPGTTQLMEYSESYVTGTSLEPFKGYYFFNGSNVNTLAIPYPFGKTIPSLSEPQVTWKLRLTFESDINRDAENYIGISPAVRTGMNDLDGHKPPLFRDQGFLYFSRPEWDRVYSKFNSDFRPSLGDGQVWDFEVANPRKSNGRIRIDGIEQIPMDYRTVLVNTMNNNPVDLRGMKDYTYATVSSTMRFKLIVGTKAFVDREVRSLMPQVVDLVQNFPNPFNGSTSISVKLPNQADIRVVIYNTLGQRIHVLADGQFPAGVHTFLWDGTGMAGGLVASGVYYYSLFTDGNIVQTRQMLLLR